MSGAQVQLEAGGTFVQDPQYTLFSRKYDTREVYVAESFEVPFDKSVPAFGGSVSVRIPPKGDLVRRLTVRSELPQLYTPLGPGYVYPQYSDEVDGSVYVQTNTVAIQPGDFVGYFNTQFLSAWATNFVGYSNLSVAYDSTLNKFVFTGVYSNIFFQNEGSASFWGFDVRSPDFVTSSGFPAYNFTGGTLTAPLTLVQAGWIRGFTPPPSNGFSYVDSVATKLIKSATLTVGGQTIDRLTSERLYLEQDFGVSYENQAGLTILEGKNDTTAVTTPREYYTKLTFNMDALNMSELYRNDVRVDVEYEKFENLAANVITSNGFLDGASYVTSNLQAITADGTQNIFPYWAAGWKNYIILGPMLNSSFRFYNQDNGTFYRWSPSSGATNATKFTINGGTIYSWSSGYIKKALISTILSSNTTPWTTSTYSFFSAFPGSPFGEGKNYITFMVSDARYVYSFYNVNYFIIGSTYTSLVSGSLAGDLHTWTINYKFYNVTAPLSATNNTSMLNFLSSFASGYSTTTVINNQATTVTLTNPGNVSELTLTFASAPAGVVVNNQVYDSGIATQLTSYITGPIRVIALSGTTVTIQFSPQTVATIPSGTKVSFRLGPSISTQTTNGSNTDLAMSAYYTALQTSGDEFIPGLNAHNNIIWGRYDSLANFNSGSSYTFTLTSQGLPASLKDIFPGQYDLVSLPNTSYVYLPTFDGRYIYFPTTGSYVTKLDTLNFSDPAGYVRVQLTSLPAPFPIYETYNQWVSDGKYLYLGSRGTYSRYDSTKDINIPAAWEYYTGDNAILNSGSVSVPAGFDGRYVYFYSGPATGPTIKRKTLWHKYDTTKPYNLTSSWQWIDFRINPNNTITTVGSDGSHPLITLDAHLSGVPSTNPNYNLPFMTMKFITGTRYIYIVEFNNVTRDEGWILSDFIQYNPVTMSNVFSSSSIITKYEKYTAPPKTGKMLYGQTDVETFTIQPGAQTSEFQLRFFNPVRELWISVDPPCVIRRLILRLNGEILVDDDQVTTKTIRAFESHSCVSNVAVVNFALDPETVAPSGTLNMSRIATPMLEIQLVSVPTAAANVRVYSKSFNVFQANNGTGGLLFNSAF